MVSSPSLDMDPDDLDVFTQPEIEQDPLKKARELLDELLDMSCEVPLSEVRDLAEDSGVSASEVLGWAEKSDTCFVDWVSGHIRCSEEEDA